LKSHREASQVQEEGNYHTGIDLNKFPIAEFDDSRNERNNIQYDILYLFILLNLVLCILIKWVNK